MAALVEVTFDIAGDVQYSRAFEVMEHEAGDMSDPLEQIGEQLIVKVGEQFETEGARTGTPWHPLSKAYATWKEEHWPGRPILVQTGDMRAAALDKARALHVTSHLMVYEIQDDKAIYHQRGQGHNPVRKIVDLGLGDRRAWDRVLHSWVQSLRTGPIRSSTSRG